MSQENAELAHQLIDALNRRDLRAYLALMHPGVVAAPRLGGIEGDYRGHDGIRRWWEDFAEFLPDFVIDVVTVRDVAGLTLLQTRMRGHGGGSATPLDEPIWTAMEWRHGKCLWWASFDTEAEALEAAGLRDAMSQENVEAARRLYDARNRGDVEAVIAECHPHVQLFPHLSSLGGVPVKGHAGLRRYLISLAEDWEEFRHDPERFFDAGDNVVAFLHVHALGRGSGVKVDVAVAHLLTFEGGRCRQNVTYLDRAEALEAAGLRG